MIGDKDSEIEFRELFSFVLFYVLCCHYSYSTGVFCMFMKLIFQKTNGSPSNQKTISVMANK